MFRTVIELIETELHHIFHLVNLLIVNKFAKDKYDVYVKCEASPDLDSLSASWREV